ncbi:hypothetical protein [Paucilactobacillus wasatchensis]|nr:hypothetical protein [Paucilactobacillus wasatchensis]
MKRREINERIEANVLVKVAGTIVISDDQKTTFLVQGKQPYEFLSIDSKTNSETALAIMLQYLKDSLRVDIDCLRLEELSMLKGTNKQTLFVFSIHDHEQKIIAACTKKQDLEFVDVAQLQQLFRTVEMDTAPFFD